MMKFEERRFADNFSQDFIDYAQTEYFLCQVAGKLLRMKDESGMTLREIAENANLKSVGAVGRIFRLGSCHNITIKTLVKLSRALGYTVAFQFTKNED